MCVCMCVDELADEKRKKNNNLHSSTNLKNTIEHFLSFKYKETIYKDP